MMLADFIPTLPIFHQRGVVTDREVRDLLGLETPDDDDDDGVVAELQAEIKRLKEHAIAEYVRGHGHGRQDQEQADDIGYAVSRPYPVGTSTLNTLVTQPTDRRGDTAEEALGESQEIVGELEAEIKTLKAELAAERTRSRKEYIRGFDSGVAYAYAFPRPQPPRYTVAPTPTAWPTGTITVTNAPPVTTGGTVTAPPFPGRTFVVNSAGEVTVGGGGKR